MPSVNQRLRVAIIGAGPAGLATLLALHKVPGVDVQVYEQARELKEVGAGISLHWNSWTVLDLLGVPPIPPESFHRNEKYRNEHWDGKTGELIKGQADDPDCPELKRHVRTPRYRLQQALVAPAPAERIHLKKRLKSLETLVGTIEVKLVFEDGEETVVDLVVGADGIRSVVRAHTFPSFRITYSGTTGYRCIFPLSRLSHIPDVPLKTVFWHGLAPDVKGKGKGMTSLFTTPIGDGLFEVSGRGPVEQKEGEEDGSWGRGARKEEMRELFVEYHPTAKAIIDAIPEETLGKYPFWGGIALDTVVANGNVALLGDASHPLSGAYGSGAAFALEDAWTLSQSISYSLSHSLPLAEALRLFDETRSPYYGELFGELRRVGKASRKGEGLGWGERVRDRMEERWGELRWVYHRDIVADWQATLARELAKNTPLVVDMAHGTVSAPPAPPVEPVAVSA
ncbi:hypothetical protein JCM8547_004636 [Rhodosporidiobolus lusitaniae]